MFAKRHSMNTTIYLATDCGLAVITDSNGFWRGMIRLAGKQVQCVVVDRDREGTVYCGTFGDGLFRSHDGGTTWKKSSLATPNVMALASSNDCVLHAGTELSAVHRSDDRGQTWRELQTLTTLPSANEWNFPPRPKTHHVQAILPSLAKPDRLHVAVEAGALLLSNDAGSTWRDRVSSGPRDTHSLAVHPQDAARLHSAAGDGYFQSIDDGDSWRRSRDGLEHEYCWSVAVSMENSSTVLLSASNNAYAAHYKQTASSYVYRSTGTEAWRQVRDGLPEPKGLRIPVLASSRIEPGVFYMSAEGRVYRSSDSGLRWQELTVQWESKETARHASNMTIKEESFKNEQRGEE